MWLNPWPFRIHVQVESNFMFSESDDDIPINSNLHGQSSKLTIFDWNWISMKTKIVIYHEIETNLTRIIFILTPTIMVSFKFYFKKRSKFRILSYMKETIIAKFRWEKVEIGDHVSNWNFSEFWMDRKWIKIWVPWIRHQMTHHMKNLLQMPFVLKFPPSRILVTDKILDIFIDIAAHTMRVDSK